MSLLLRRLWLVIALLLVPFAVATALGGWNEAPSLPGGVVLAAAILIGVLAADVVLPVPSSAVLIAAGATLGPVTGAVAGTIGLIVGAAFGYALGAQFGRDLTGVDAERARTLVERWGPAAVVITRPVPLLAESTAIVAGSAHMRRGRFLAAAVVGAVPTAVGLSLAGHAGADSLGGTELGVVVIVTAALAGATAVSVRGSRPANS
ncbi:MAG: hypothetical protein HKN41_03820 [Ilumatobacter sp.]|nr:hypothetical protein [Ilumatobacter sp.]